MSEKRESKISEPDALQLLIWSWGHDLTNKTLAVLNLVSVTKSLLPSPNFQEVILRLDQIEEIIGEIARIPSPLNLEQVPINEFIGSRIERMQKRFSEVQFLMDLAPSESTVRANPVWLRHILDILIDNAVTAMSKSPIKKIRISTRAVGHGVSIQVTDTGRGIDSVLIPSLFQQPSILMEGRKGRGLYIAKLIADMYGGKIDLQCTDATGTTMVIWLPLD